MRKDKTATQSLELIGAAVVNRKGSESTGLCYTEWGHGKKA